MNVSLRDIAASQLRTDTSVEAARSLDVEAIFPQGCGNPSEVVARNVVPPRPLPRGRRRGRSDKGQREQDSEDPEASHATSR